MKMMKKLMAVALAGVMALTLLAGCGNPYALTEKELLNALTDVSPVTLNNGAKVTLKAADNTDAAKVMQALAGKDLEADDFILQNAADWETVLSIKDEEAVGISCVKVTEVKSETMNKLQNLGYASTLVRGIQGVSESAPKNGSEGTVSVKIGKIGDAEYIVMVLRAPGETGTLD